MRLISIKLGYFKRLQNNFILLKALCFLPIHLQNVTVISTSRLAIRPHVTSRYLDLYFIFWSENDRNQSRIGNLCRNKFYDNLQPTTKVAFALLANKVIIDAIAVRVVGEFVSYKNLAHLPILLTSEN